ncbi:MAG: GNAT family protein [Winkia neuii]|nr:GNAT family protein [Winkia neuii]MDK8099681.1 GNAT family protein [Winkia neuii]MDU3135511.1 GNAT family protein [Winkia neuii]
MTQEDHVRVAELRYGEREWLGPWEASAPVGYRVQAPTFAQYVANCNRQILEGRMLPFLVEGDGAPMGQLTISDISRAATQSCAIGYWISQRWANMGLMTLAVAMALDCCFSDLNLHRAEINIRPENARSLAIPRKLGLRNEGLRKKYICIDGTWADHVSFAATVEDAGAGYVALLLRNRHKSCG